MVADRESLCIIQSGEYAMLAKNYYVALGVSRDESSTGIRSAYHEIARRMHPDIAGPGDKSRFQEINEAYGVLSDPDRRRALDRDFGGGLYEKSERCARESLALRRLLEDQSLAARALNKLGEVQQASGRARLAIKSFEEVADKGVHARVLPQPAASHIKESRYSRTG